MNAASSRRCTPAAHRVCGELGAVVHPDSPVNARFPWSSPPTPATHCEHCRGCRAAVQMMIRFHENVQQVHRCWYRRRWGNWTDPEEEIRSDATGARPPGAAPSRSC